MQESFGDSSGIELFTSEVVGAVGRVNYNQRVGELNALAGLVSLLPSTDSRVFTIQVGWGRGLFAGRWWGCGCGSRGWMDRAGVDG